VIVRILHEGQYRLSGATAERLRDADARLVADLGAMDEEGFRAAYGEMLTLVRREGTPLPEAEIHESDLILPAADTTLEEARALFHPGGGGPAPV
jgi:hypothetical protein